MKAAQIVGFETPYKINDIPKPVPQGNQILLRVKAAGFCHTVRRVPILTCLDCQLEVRMRLSKMATLVRVYPSQVAMKGLASLRLPEETLQTLQ